MALALPDNDEEMRPRQLPHQWRDNRFTPVDFIKLPHSEEVRATETADENGVCGNTGRSCWLTGSGEHGFLAIHILLSRWSAFRIASSSPRAVQSESEALPHGILRSPTLGRKPFKAPVAYIPLFGVINPILIAPAPFPMSTTCATAEKSRLPPALMNITLFARTEKMAFNRLPKSFTATLS